VEPWEVQPIHNFYFLVATEYGLFFLGSFLLLVLFHVKRGTQILFNAAVSSRRRFVLLTLLSGVLMFLILMMFDHYFYTSQQGLILLWLWLGLLAGFTTSNVSHET
jgi:hypothetical protein